MATVTGSQRNLNFVSNNYAQATFGGGGDVTNTYLTATFTSNNYVQSQLGLKLNSSSYTASDVLTKIKTVDGAGSGLDADTLDGLNSTSLTSNNYIQTQLGTKLNSSSYTASDVLTKIKTVDGSGSGLDADTLDGLQGSSYSSNNYITDHYTSNNYIQTYVAAQVASVVDSAPAALDTLNELAAALGDDANFSTTVSNQIGLRATNTYVNSTFSSNNYLQGQLSTKLNSSSYTASDVLTKIKTVDGSGSGLDADLLDGLHSSSFSSNAYLQSQLSGSSVSNAYIQAQGYLTTETGDVSNTYLQAQGYLTTETGDVSNTYLQATFDPNADVSNTYLQATFDPNADVSNTYLQAQGYLTTETGDVSNTYLQAQGYLTTETGDVSNTYLQAQGYLTTETGDVSNTYLQTMIATIDQTNFDAGVTGNNFSHSSLDVTYTEVFINGIRLASDDFTHTANTVNILMALDSTDDITVICHTAGGPIASTNVSNTYLQSGTTLLIKDSTGSTLKTIKSIP